MFLFDGYGMQHSKNIQEENKSEKVHEDFAIVDRIEGEDNVCQPYLVKYIG